MYGDSRRVSNVPRDHTCLKRITARLSVVSLSLLAIICCTKPEEPSPPADEPVGEIAESGVSPSPADRSTVASEDRPPQIPGMCSHPEGTDRGESMEAFALDLTEVTLGEYQKCVAAEICRPVSMRDMRNELVPVESVTWFDALAFCDWRGKGLPDWRQWSWAAKGGDAGLEFPWGSDEPTCEHYVRPGNDEKRCGSRRALPVGDRTRGKSRYGCLDLVGNVNEWLSSGEARDRDVAASIFTDGPRVRISMEHYLRNPWDSNINLGFRCAKSFNRDTRAVRSARPPTTPSDSHLDEVKFIRVRGVGELGDYHIMAHEVTVAQYVDCVRKGACPEPKLLPEPWVCNWDLEGHGDHPMNCIDVSDASAFCSAQGGSLPTEEQWDWAARRGDFAQRYPWGKFDEDDSICNYAHVALGPHDFGCGNGDTAEVKNYPRGATKTGIYDMLGNVWEIVETRDGHVRRGAGWDTWLARDGEPISLSARMTVSDVYSESTGFRCVK
jgi:formylglycine-generating enzyme required for sulfatase activity